jgi:hypothetical protein
MFGSDEHVFRLANQPRVHLTYQTAFVDDAGKLELRDDVYGFDGRIDDILHGRQPRTAAAAPSPPSKRDARTTRTIRSEPTRSCCAGSSGRKPIILLPSTRCAS